MPKQETDFANIVALAGIIQRIKIQETSAFFLLDVTGDAESKATKWIPCNVYKEEGLLQRLERYENGDHIKVRGFVRAWSQKKDGEWKNGVDVRVTEIKSEDPQREPKSKPRQTAFDQPYDEDIPF